MTTPVEPPQWEFSRAQDLHCPVCKALLSGLDWITGEQQGMSLVPCGHVLVRHPTAE